MVQGRRFSGKMNITFIDIFIVIFSYFVAFFIRGILDNDPYLSLTKALYSIPFVFVIFALTMYINNLILSGFNINKARYIFRTFSNFCLGFFITIFILFYLKMFTYSRLALFIFFIISITLLLFERLIIFKIIQPFKVLIIGEKEEGENFTEMFNKVSIYKIEPLMIIDGKKEEIVRFLKKIVKTNNIDWVFILKEGMEDVIDLCSEAGIPASYSIDILIKRPFYFVSIEEIGNKSFVSFHRNYFEEAEISLKYALDKILAIIFIILFSPLFVVIPVLIKLTSKGPIIFKQVRVGLNGKKFVLYKFRTMYENAEEMKKSLEKFNEMEIAFKIRNDPRVTKIGRYLRKYSFDEIPQFINVLKGDMSIVGPRPPVPEEIEKYELWHRRRLSMKPGLTCLWQISGRNEINFKQWMELDLKYIDNWSLWLDVYILLKTIPEVLRGRGAY
uniref:Sugar transferase n=1 Tax=candidate division WOR-3 bacterium TaxID=2052148 RepID=A0A7C4Y5S0_UNCW3